MCIHKRCHFAIQQMLGLLILIVAEARAVNFLRVTCLEADSAGTAWNVCSKGTFDRLRSIEQSAGRKPWFMRRGSRSTVEILISRPTAVSVMGRSPNGMDVDVGIKKEENGVLMAITVKEETCDIKMENGTVSVTAKVEASSIDMPKTKRTRQLFAHLPSTKQEVLSQFTEIKESLYQYEELGESQQPDVMACECKPLKSGIPLPNTL